MHWDGKTCHPCPSCTAPISGVELLYLCVKCFACLYVCGVMLPEETEKGVGSLNLDLEKIASHRVGTDSERERVPLNRSSLAPGFEF